MKNLFKLTAVALATTISLTSCNESVSSSGDAIYTVLTELESTNYESGKVATYELDFERYDVEVSGTEYALPRLSKISATNGEFRTAKYSYTEDDDATILNIEVQDDNGLRNENYKLNDLGMAEEIMVDDAYTALENVTYNSSGYRTSWGDYTLSSDGGVYSNAKGSNGSVVSYNYTQYTNRIGFQQLGIIGADLYQNISDNFGKQSRQLLSEVMVEDNGEDVTYKFTYSLSAEGLVLEELIYRNGEKYQYNKYSYAMVVYKDEEEPKE